MRSWKVIFKEQFELHEVVRRRAVGREDNDHVQVAEHVARCTGSGAGLTVGANSVSDLLIPDRVNLGRLRPLGLLENPIGESQFLIVGSFAALRASSSRSLSDFPSVSG